MWQLGRSKKIKDAVKNLDALFQEMFPEASEDDPQLFHRLMKQPLSRVRKPKPKLEEDGNRPIAANS